MREIKFRVWDKKRKEMQFVSKARDFDWLGSAIEQPERYEIMQYTGLKNKNGTEIYEGDILGSQFDSNHEVYWSNEYASFYTRTPSDWGYGLTPSNREVIGNIYENPELLK